MLVAGPAVDRDDLAPVLLPGNFQLDADSVADTHRLAKAQALAQIDGARAGQFHGQGRGDHRPGQHTVGDALPERRGRGESGVQVYRVDVARDHCEQLDVAFLHLLGPAGRLPHGDLFIGKIA